MSVVVVVGLAIGLEMLAAESPVVVVQAYVTPATAVMPIGNPVGFCVHVFVKSRPASAKGMLVFTVTTT